MFDRVLNKTRQSYQQDIIMAEFLLAYKRFSSQKQKPWLNYLRNCSKSAEASASRFSLSCYLNSHVYKEEYYSH